MSPYLRAHHLSRCLQFTQIVLTMDCCKRLVLLGLGLCLVSVYVNATLEEEIHVYSDNFFNRFENMAVQLQNLKEKQTTLETELSNAWDTVKKANIQTDLYCVKNTIAHIERTSKVSYQDYIRMKTELKQQYEKELAEMQKKMETARSQAKAKEYASYQQSYKILSREKLKIDKEFRNYMEATKLNEQRINQVKEKLEQEKLETIKTLESAKEKHARTIDALSANPNEGYRSVRIKQQATINELKHDLKEFVNMKDKKKQFEGLLLTKMKLTSLLPALYEQSKFYPETDRKDMEDARAVMEMNTLIVRDEQNKQRKELLDKMKNKDLTELSDEEIESLRKINEKLAVTEMFQQEVVTRSAYLKGLLEVDDLIKECSDAIESCNQGTIAKFLTQAIEEAKNGNLAKLWTRA